MRSSFTPSCIRLKFHEDDYKLLHLGSDDGPISNDRSIFRAKSDSNQFVLTQEHYLIVGSNGDSKTIKPALLKNDYVEKHSDHKSEYVFDIIIPKDELEAISTHGFKYELLDCELL